jgi:hypothetical protein
VSGLKIEVDPAEVGLDSQRLERIDTFFARYVEDGRLPGWLLTVSRQTLSGERIQETHSGRCEIAGIARDQDPVMNQGSCRHKAVNYRHGVRDVETPPCLGHPGGDRDDAVAVGVNQSAEPPFEDLSCQLSAANRLWRSRFSWVSRRVCGLGRWLRVGDVRQ